MCNLFIKINDRIIRDVINKIKRMSFKIACPGRDSNLGLNGGSQSRWPLSQEVFLNNEKNKL